MQGFAALADPTRRRIVELLAEGELSAGQIASRFAISQPAVSQHLRTLRAARVIRCRTDAQRRIYSIDPSGLSELDDWLARYRHFWAQRLEALEEQLRPAGPVRPGPATATHTASPSRPGPGLADEEDR